MLLRAYGELEERMATALDGRGNKTDQILDAVARRIGPFAISDLEAELPNISRDMIRHVLRNLKKDNKVLVLGKGRGATWDESGEL